MASGQYHGGLAAGGKKKMSREFAYCMGLLTMPFAIALSTKANLGLSMIAAPAYIISEKAEALSYGQAEYIVQTLVLILMCLIVNKFKLSYLFSFITSILYGTLLDVEPIFRPVPMTFLSGMWRRKSMRICENLKPDLTRHFCCCRCCCLCFYFTDSWASASVPL